MDETEHTRKDMNNMASLAFAVLLTPGKTEEWKRWNEELAGPRRIEYLASRQRLGITTERAYLQHTPQGDMDIVYLEADDLQRAFQGLATSQDPFDVWFRQRAKELFSGLDLTQPPPGPLAELGFDVLGR
jgi:hypothetical protein